MDDHCHHVGGDDQPAAQCPARKEMNANDVQTWGDNIYSDTARRANGTVAYIELYCCLKNENQCVLQLHIGEIRRQCFAHDVQSEQLHRQGLI